jgi:hypothetical protein
MPISDQQHHDCHAERHAEPEDVAEQMALNARRRW